ncbi:unnamed protein product [Hyaloperonospora brassicae]|uniref:UBA domain-containing protein n=1 Tax=Hyaloperonospora brassicae TaxID=162125 RepID=A0AAV0ULH6_HYABA|nr:unnamed protein product [Hyaloperonospora brassicae]
MRVLRVRCVDDGRELFLERSGAQADRIRVAELKQWILQQRQQLRGNAASPLRLDDCFVLLRGQIVADPDVLDLNTLLPSDFFLVAMGFPAAAVAQALRQSHNDLTQAALLLVEGKVYAVAEQKGSKASEATTNSSARQCPSSPLGHLVHDENMRKLRTLAATNSFEALLLLKDQFSSELLNQLNENPVATLQLLLLPASATSSPSVEGEVIDCSNDAVDSESGRKVAIAASSSMKADAVERLVAMGFARDLVEMLFESCGGDEQLTAHALLQTLES